jgi:hypothetical protein
LLYDVASAQFTGNTTVCDYHASNRIYERFKIMVDLRLDSGFEDKAGRTPVDVAADPGQKEILELFRVK